MSNLVCKNKGSYGGLHLCPCSLLLGIKIGFQDSSFELRAQRGGLCFICPFVPASLMPYSFPIHPTFVNTFIFKEWEGVEDIVCDSIMQFRAHP
jgi:hypothetical protein